MCGMLSTTLQSMIDICDNQYVRLDNIITKTWLKDLMRHYKSLYTAESRADASLLLTQQVSPLIDYIRERLEKQMLSR